MCHVYIYIYIHMCVRIYKNVIVASIGYLYQTFCYQTFSEVGVGGTRALALSLQNGFATHIISLPNLSEFCSRLSLGTESRFDHQVIDAEI